MDRACCPSCARPYTPGEVIGLGILRARPEAEGGPYVEFPCPGCGRRLYLVPHGAGRFARPGEPPPPETPESDRRPPWIQRPPATGGARRAEPPPATPDPPPPPPPPRRRAPPSAVPGGEEDPPMTVARALELLGIGPEADRATLDRAFRERSRTCHPDKVAHLDADFQALAARKFRELKRAHDLLAG